MGGRAGQGAGTGFVPALEEWRYDRTGCLDSQPVEEIAPVKNGKKAFTRDRTKALFHAVQEALRLAQQPPLEGNYSTTSLCGALLIFLGRVSSRTPFSYRALAAASSISAGSWKLRDTAP